MTSREQFEAWLCATYGWGEDALASAFYQGDDATGYYIGGDYIYDGFSCNDPLFWAWRGWQASHEAVEIELPPRQRICASGYGDGYFVYSPEGEGLVYDDVVEAISAAGIKVKED